MTPDSQARQCCKIREIGDALVTAGFLTLDEQAEAFGLARSTTWTILRGTHKASGLSAAIINRMLMSPRLPSPARAKVVEYVEEKCAGLHGHNVLQLRRFTAHLSINWTEDDLRHFFLVGFPRSNARPTRHRPGSPR